MTANVDEAPCRFLKCKIEY